MTINELKNMISGVEGAVYGRTNKTNFIVVPCDEGFAKVEVKLALAKDSDKRTAFNYDAAVAEYKVWETESALREAERANKPAKVKGVNPEAQARRDELDAKVAALPSFTEYAATDIRKALGTTVADNVTVMAVGSSAKRLVEKGMLTVSTKENDKKSYYTKA